MLCCCVFVGVETLYLRFSESLADCQERVLTFWRESMLPTLMPQSCVLIVAHSNTLRALVAHLDEVPVNMIPHIHIPNSVPCVYQINNQGEQGNHRTVVSASTVRASQLYCRGQWMFSAENYERLAKKIGGSESFARSIFQAWDGNGDGVLSRPEIEMGLAQFRNGTRDVAIRAIAGKLWEEVRTYTERNACTD